MVDQFFGEARGLRAHFEKQFENPREAHSGRFVWDWWNVPGQYTLLRTPAYHYFPAPLYRRFHEALVSWGRENLGCHDISPPWLSTYVEGCKQELHGDVPHGPWAFVYSLTPWQERVFRGGETTMLREEVLDYWSHVPSGSFVEREQLVTEIEPKFNRLTVFDPRIPHGVNEVRGVSDPRQGRLVIHGWFVQPRPFIQGPLKAKALQEALFGLEEILGQVVASGSLIQGVLSLRLTVSASGKVESVKLLADRLRAPGSEVELCALVRRAIVAHLKAWKFPRSSGRSVATVPVVFEAG